ncbi:MAG: G8 domain-containing protein [Actinomycetota bacterium]
MAAVAGALALESPHQLLSRSVALAKRKRKPSLWSDPATWRGRVPRPKDVAVVRGTVVLDKHVRVAGVVIRPRGRLIFHPRRSVSLTTTGNLVVEGRLVMRPKKTHRSHRITFARVDEAAFKGGGHAVLGSDVGLWVMGHGRLTLSGSPKLAWTRAVGSIGAGSTTLALQDDPVGWRPGDLILIAPTASPASSSHTSFDSAKIAAVSGRTVTLASATERDHPAIDAGEGKVFTAEVLNLTRNVVIEGRDGGRAHVFIHTHRPQSIRHAELRHLGPQQGNEGVLGRYPLHFHHSGDGSRGSIVEGVVIRESGAHAFVPHRSHGITMRDCIAHRTVGAAYWWDPQDITNDLRWEHCAAMEVLPESGDFHRLSAFVLGEGEQLSAQRCVAVGVIGGKNSSGFIWPEKSGDVWGFQDNMAHNCVNGAFVWQNGPESHPIQSFIAYRNESFGFHQGAYRSSYLYRGLTLYENGSGGMNLQAVPPGGGIEISDSHIEGEGPLIVIQGHNDKVPPETAYVVRRSVLRSGGTKLEVRGESQPDQVDVHDSGLLASDVDVSPAAMADTIVRIYENGQLVDTVEP